MVDKQLRESRLALDRAAPCFDANGRLLPQFTPQGDSVRPPASNCNVCAVEYSHVHMWIVTCPACSWTVAAKAPGVYRFLKHTQVLGSRNCLGAMKPVKAVLTPQMRYG
jgi:hypothetical protein